MLRDVFSQAQLCWVLPVQVLKQLIYLCVYNRDVCAGVQVCRCVQVCAGVCRCVCVCVCVWCVCVCVCLPSVNVCLQRLPPYPLADTVVYHFSPVCCICKDPTCWSLGTLQTNNGAWRECTNTHFDTDLLQDHQLGLRLNCLDPPPA